MKNFKAFLAAVIASAFIVLPAVSGFSVYGAEYDVRVTGADGSVNEYASLSEAASISRDGDTIELLRDIELAPGGTVTFSGAKSVTLLGNGHKVTMQPSNGNIIGFIQALNGVDLKLGTEDDLQSSTLILDGEKLWTTQPLININSQSTVSIYDGVTVTNSHGAGGVGSTAVVVSGGSAFNMHGGEISGNFNKILGIGGGIFCSDSTLSITGGKIADNQVQGDSQYGYGAAVYAQNSKVSIFDCVISGNVSLGESEGFGGAVMLLGTDGTAVISGCEITGNKAPYGGAVFAAGLNQNAVVEIRDSVITGNSAAVAGGAIAAMEADISISGTVITENTSTAGGGIFLDSDASFSMDESSAIYNNTATVAADDIYASEDGTLLKLAAADTMDTESYAVNGWFEDFAPDDEDYLPLTSDTSTLPGRFTGSGSAVKVSDTVFSDKYVCLKAAGVFTVKYTDGCQGSCFEDQTYTLRAGEDTPAFIGTPEREGYIFLGWDRDISPTVTGDAVYTAQWEPISASGSSEVSSGSSDAGGSNPGTSDAGSIMLLVLAVSAGAIVFFCFKRFEVK